MIWLLEKSRFFIYHLCKLANFRSILHKPACNAANFFLVFIGELCHLVKYLSSMLVVVSGICRAK